MSTLNTSQKYRSASRQALQAIAAATAWASSAEATLPAPNVGGTWFLDESDARSSDLLLSDLVGQDLFRNARCKFRLSGPLSTFPQIELGSGLRAPQAIVGLGGSGDTASGLVKILTSNAMRRVGEDGLSLADEDSIDVLNLRLLQSPHFRSEYGSSTEHLARNLSSWWGTAVLDPKQELLAGYERYSANNWDGEGAEPISGKTLDYARLIVMGLPNNFGPPDASPGLDGSIALEWVPENHKKLHKLFFDIGPGPRWRAYWKLKTGEFDRLIGETTEVRQILQPLFDKLS